MYVSLESFLLSSFSGLVDSRQAIFYLMSNIHLVSTSSLWTNKHIVEHVERLKMAENIHNGKVMIHDTRDN